MPSMFDINKYCQKKACANNIGYVKQQTSGNNPNISEKMRYSEYVRQYQTMNTK